MPNIGNPNDWVCDDPDDPRGDSCMIRAEVVKNRAVYTDKALWAKARALKRSDIWTAAGFGDVSPKLNGWTIEQLDELGQTFGDQLGLKYTGVKRYGICCSCG